MKEGSYNYKETTCVQTAMKGVGFLPRVKYESPVGLAIFLKSELDTLGLKPGESRHFYDSHWGELLLESTKTDHLSACGDLSTHEYRFSLVREEGTAKLNRDNLTVATIKTGHTMVPILFGKAVENKTIKDKKENMDALVAMVCRLSEEHTLGRNIMEESVS